MSDIFKNIYIKYFNNTKKHTKLYHIPNIINTKNYSIRD